MFYHRMYLRRCSMSSISEESETADDEKQDDQTKLSTTNNLAKVDVQNCLGDLNSFKQVEENIVLSSDVFFFFEGNSRGL